MKTTQFLIGSTVLLLGTAGLAQEADDQPADAMHEDMKCETDTEGAASTTTTTTTSEEKAPEVVVTPPAPAPTVVAPVVIENKDTEVAAKPAGYLGGFGRRSNFGGAIAEVKAGVGGGDYTGDNVQARTSAATLWNVRAVFGGHTPIGVEGAYVGSSRNVSGIPGATGDTQLVSNGLEGDLRLALPIKASEMIDVRPFAFGGLGWQYMSFWGDGSVDGADRAQDPGDNIMTVPAGLGIELGVGPLNLEARGTYRAAIGSDLFGTDNGFNDADSMSTWDVGGAVGLEF